jgi:hypothetical protein
MSSSQLNSTLGLRRATPPPQYADSSDSETEQWHDAVDVSLNGDLEAPASSSRPQSPIDPAAQAQSLKVSAFYIYPFKLSWMLKRLAASPRGSE